MRHVPASPGGRDSDSGCSGDNITDSGRGSNEDVSMELKQQNQRRSAGNTAKQFSSASLGNWHGYCRCATCGMDFQYAIQMFGRLYGHIPCFVKKNENKS